MTEEQRIYEWYNTHHTFNEIMLYYSHIPHPEHKTGSGVIHAPICEILRFHKSNHFIKVVWSAKFVSQDIVAGFPQSVRFKFGDNWTHSVVADFYIFGDTVSIGWQSKESPTIDLDFKYSKEIPA